MAQGRPPLHALAHHEEHARQPPAHRLRGSGQEGPRGEQTGGENTRLRPIQRFWISEPDTEPN